MLAQNYELYQIVEDKELIELIENNDDNTINIHLEISELLKNNPKRKINDT